MTYIYTAAVIYVLLGVAWWTYCYVDLMRHGTIFKDSRRD